MGGDDSRSTFREDLAGPGPGPRAQAAGARAQPIPAPPGPSKSRARVHPGFHARNLPWPGSGVPFKKKMVLVSNESGFMNHVAFIDHVLVAQMALIEEEERRWESVAHVRKIRSWAIK